MNFLKITAPDGSAAYVDADAVKAVAPYGDGTQSLLIIDGQLLRAVGAPGDILIDIAQARGVQNVAPIPF